MYFLVVVDFWFEVVLNEIVGYDGIYCCERDEFSDIGIEMENIYFDVFLLDKCFCDVVEELFECGIVF